MQHRRIRPTMRARSSNGVGKSGFFGRGLTSRREATVRPELSRGPRTGSRISRFPTASIFEVGKSGFFRHRGSLHWECLSSRVKWLPVPSPSREGRRRGIQFPDFPTLGFRGREKWVFWPPGVPPPGMSITPSEVVAGPRVLSQRLRVQHRVSHFSHSRFSESGKVGFLDGPSFPDHRTAISVAHPFPFSILEASPCPS
jgi:hypothetical protein